MSIPHCELVKEEHPGHLLFRFDGLRLKTDRFDRTEPDSIIGLGINSGPHLLMNHLRNHPGLVRGRRVLEAFAGSGPLGLAALRYGAREVAFVDINPRAMDFISENIQASGLPREQCSLHAQAIESYAPEQAFDVVLANPPFIPTPPSVNAPINSDGGPDGNILFEMFMKRLPSLLAPTGDAFAYAFQFERQGRPVIERAFLIHIPERSITGTRMLERSVSIEVLYDEYIAKAPRKVPAIDAWLQAMRTRHGDNLSMNWYIFHIAPVGGRPGLEVRTYSGEDYGPGFFPWRTLEDHELVRSKLLALIEFDGQVFW